MKKSTWSKESYKIAKEFGYSTKEGEKVTKEYIAKVT